MGLLRMAARTAVVAGTATAVSRPRATAAGQQVGRAGPAAGAAAVAQQQQQPQYAQEAPPEDDSTAQLQKLAALHTQGVLTDEEFAAAKAKILGI